VTISLVCFSISFRKISWLFLHSLRCLLIFPSTLSVNTFIRSCTLPICVEYPSQVRQQTPKDLLLTLSSLHSTALICLCISDLNCSVTNSALVMMSACSFSSLALSSSLSCFFPAYFVPSSSLFLLYLSALPVK
jgi:hypothetical protein